MMCKTIVFTEMAQGEFSSQHAPSLHPNLHSRRCSNTTELSTIPVSVAAVGTSVSHITPEWANTAQKMPVVKDETGTSTAMSARQGLVSLAPAERIGGGTGPEDSPPIGCSIAYEVISISVCLGQWRLPFPVTLSGS